MILWLVERIPGLGIVWLSLSVHEWAHAWAAFRLGDDTARAQGRLSLDPLVHLDLLGSLILPILGVPLGWAVPVPVEPRHFTRKLPMAAGMAVVAAAGPASNLMIALWALASLVIGVRLGAGPESIVTVILLQVVHVNVFLALFNLSPIPPLDGSRLVAYALPPSLAGLWARLERVGPVLMVPVAIGLGLFVTPVLDGLMELIFFGR